MHESLCRTIGTPLKPDMEFSKSRAAILLAFDMQILGCTLRQRMSGGIKVILADEGETEGRAKW